MRGSSRVKNVDPYTARSSVHSPENQWTETCIIGLKIIILPRSLPASLLTLVCFFFFFSGDRLASETLTSQIKISTGSSIRFASTMPTLLLLACCLALQQNALDFPKTAQQIN